MDLWCSQLGSRILGLGSDLASNLLGWISTCVVVVFSIGFKDFQIGFWFKGQISAGMS